MRYLGIDYGTEGIGLALSDPEGGFAFPHSVLPSTDSALEYIRALVEREKVGIVVVGDTRALNGGENAVTTRAEEFISRLERNLGMPVVRVNEAWSTFEAARFAPGGKKHDDSAAAAIILQRYLDALPKNE